jgi:hypothetical protein
MGSTDGPIPTGKITAFDKNQYDKLIKYVESVDVDLNTNLEKPSSGVRLDGSLGSGFFPGSQQWPVAAAFINQGKQFGGSVKTQYDTLSGGWEQFVTALTNARNVFDDTNDLTKYSAATFTTDFPDVSGSGPPGGGPGAGGK